MTPMRVSWVIPHLCGIPNSRRYSRLLLMFRSFIDETGNDPSEPVFCFHGWVARVNEWERFSDAWAIGLRQSPFIEYYSHHESKSQTKQFEGWTKSACDQKTLALAKVITESEIRYGVATGIQNRVVRDLLKSAVPPIKTVRSILHVGTRPYDWAFHSVISIVLQLQVNFGETDKVDFVFDEGDPAFEDCARIYRQVRDILPPALKAIAGTVTTGDDKTMMPLQAADLLTGVSTVRLRGQTIGEAYKLIQSKKKIYFCPITRKDNPFPNFNEILTLLNVVWSTKMIGQTLKRGQL